jgi:ubiquinone/menaquinone biosynthesis C-methylase UbiE
LFAVLTYIPSDDDQRVLLAEVRRVLRPEGILYISDLLINTDLRNLERYERDADQFGVYGVFELPEGVIVRHHREEWDWLLQHLRSQARILDHGCGYGRLLNQLSEAGYGNAVGMDFSDKMLMQCRSQFPHLTLVRNDGLTLPFRDRIGRLPVLGSRIPGIARLRARMPMLPASGRSPPTKTSSHLERRRPDIPIFKQAKAEYARLQ